LRRINDEELFLDKLARENEEAGMEKRQHEDYVPINKWLVPYLGIEKHHVATSGGAIDNINVLPAFTPSMSPLGQSHLPNLVEITDVSANSSSPMMESHGYTVQSRVSSPVGEADETQGDIYSDLAQDCMLLCASRWHNTHENIVHEYYTQQSSTIETSWDQVRSIHSMNLFTEDPRNLRDTSSCQVSPYQAKIQKKQLVDCSTTRPISSPSCLVIACKSNSMQR
jgi:hypothetical protein